jgi:hypothetical protein
MRTGHTRWRRTALLAVGPLFMALAVCASQAATLSPASFSYDAQDLAFNGVGENRTPVYGTWNPTRLATDAKGSIVGVHLFFFGRAQGCPGAASNGNAGPLNAAQVASLRRESLPVPVTDAMTVWSPVPDVKQCPGSAGTSPGPAFIASSPTAGLSLLTSVGQGQVGGPHPFWQQRDSTGQLGSGNNQFIEGTFVNWNFDRQKQQAVQAWPGGTGGSPLRIRSRQAVPAANIESPSDDAAVNQAKQQISINLFNPDCPAAVAKPELCQVRYLFLIDVIRRSQKRAVRGGWLMFDKQEAGMPVLIGPLESAGQPTLAGPQRDELWRSTGAPTQNAPFDTLQFGADLDFADFISGLRLIARRTNPDGGSDGSEMASLFGPTWRDPAAWLVITVDVSQELHSESPTMSNYIGGSVSDLYIGH